MAKKSFTGMEIDDVFLQGYKDWCKKRGRSVKSQTIKLIEQYGKKYVEKQKYELENGLDIDCSALPDTDTDWDNIPESTDEDTNEFFNN